MWSPTLPVFLLELAVSNNQPTCSRGPDYICILSNDQCHSAHNNYLYHYTNKKSSGCLNDLYMIETIVFLHTES